jgi:hypothetical protein
MSTGGASKTWPINGAETALRLTLRFDMHSPDSRRERYRVSQSTDAWPVAAAGDRLKVSSQTTNCEPIRDHELGHAENLIKTVLCGHSHLYQGKSTILH